MRRQRSGLQEEQQRLAQELQAGLAVAGSAGAAGGGASTSASQAPAGVLERTREVETEHAKLSAGLVEVGHPLLPA